MSALPAMEGSTCSRIRPESKAKIINFRYVLPTAQVSTREPLMILTRAFANSAESTANHVLFIKAVAAA